MRFVTIAPKESIKEFINSGQFSDNCIYELTENQKHSLMNVFEDFSGKCCSPVVGLILDDCNSLEDDWRSLSNVLPIKSGDIVLEFSANKDRMLFCRFDKFVSTIYSNSGVDLGTILEYEPNGKKVLGFVDSFKLLDFVKGYVVNSEFNKEPLKDSYDLCSMSLKSNTINDVNIFG